VNHPRTGIERRFRQPNPRSASRWKMGYVGKGASALLGFVMALAMTSAARGQEGATPPHWIWYPTGKSLDRTPAESRYFRKTFAVKEPSRLVLEATADNAFTLYLDGKAVAKGDDWLKPQKVEVSVPIGPHVLAARASNEAPGPAGLLVRGSVLPLGQGVPIHTNSSWRTEGTVPPGDAWTQVGFDDSK